MKSSPGVPQEFATGSVCLALFRRDLSLIMRRKHDSLSAVFFFVVVCSLFPLGIGPDPDRLRMLAPGGVWLAALLASLLSLGRLFSEDLQDGTLDLLLLSPTPLPLLVLAKVAAQWVASGLLLVVVAPLLAAQFDLPADQTLLLLASLLIGTPVLSLMGALGAALTLGGRGGGLLLSLLVLPLVIPVLIFGSGAVIAKASGLPPDPYLYLLGALLALSLFLAPIATAAALRVAVE
jgi:heme exporter protein B